MTEGRKGTIGGGWGQAVGEGTNICQPKTLILKRYMLTCVIVTKEQCIKIY